MFSEPVFREERFYLLTPNTLRLMLPNGMNLIFWHHRIVANPLKFHLQLPMWAERSMAWIPQWLVLATRQRQPTLIAKLVLAPEESRVRVA